MQVLAKRTQTTKLPLQTRKTPPIVCSLNEIQQVWENNSLGNDCVASQTAAKMRIQLMCIKIKWCITANVTPPQFWAVLTVMLT